MPPTGPRTEFLKLTTFTSHLEYRYLAPHLKAPTLGPPSKEEELDVAAYSVLAHGAFENFVEGLALWIVGRVQKNWLKNRISRSTLALLLDMPFKADYENDTRIVFDIVRTALDDAKGAHSLTIERNNGIAMKHLRTLLLPLGVDVPTDPILTGSLDTLVKMRHTWAHQYRYGARTLKSAIDARQTVGDCLDLAKRLYLNTAAMKL